MALILCIETATTVCSVSLASEGRLLSFKEENSGYSHAEHLTLYIMDVMKDAGKNLSGLDAVAVSMGPGSYTGLRIGVSTAKGLCYALDKPLISIPTLKAMALSQLQTSNLSTGVRIPSDKPQTLLCPMIDARRMEVFCAVYNIALDEVRKTAAEIIDKNSFSDLLKEHRIIFFGDGAPKCKAALAHHPNAIFQDAVFPSARYMIDLAEKKYAQKQFEDVVLFEPFYLKDFVDGGKK